MPQISILIKKNYRAETLCFLNYVNPPTCWWRETRGRRTSPAPGSGWPGSAGRSLKMAICWLYVMYSVDLYSFNQRSAEIVHLLSPDTSSSRRLGQLSSMTARWESNKLSLKTSQRIYYVIRWGFCRDSCMDDIVLTYSTLDLLLT